jgi:hypothetical protein
VQRRWQDRLTPSAAGPVSRAWVIDAVDAAGIDPHDRQRVIDDLVSFEPPRRHGIRNTFIFWAGVIGAAMGATAIGLPGWTGFAFALVCFAWIGRELAVRALRWRLDQWREPRAEEPQAKAQK